MFNSLKSFIREMCSEDSQLSMTRFLTLMITVVSLAIAIYSVVKDKNNTELVALLLGSGLTAKVTQRFAEEKNAKLPEDGQPSTTQDKP